MKKIGKIIHLDMKRLGQSVVAVVVIMGLCLVPSLYAWFNILSNWDPYGPASTSNIKVAVANEDDGCELLGLHLNIGEMVMEGLESNDQMGWVFLDTRDEALSGVYSGEYYAALIVPPEFTGDFLSILDGNMRHPQIEYYENEKKNAIAPKITGKAKTAVQEQINNTIVEKAADAINAVSSMVRAFGLDSDDIANSLTSSLDNACNQLKELTLVLSSVKNLMSETGNLLEVSAATINDAGNVVINAGNTVGSVSNAIGTGSSVAGDLSNSIVKALDDIDKDLDSLLGIISSWGGSPLLKQAVNQILDNLEAKLQALKGRIPDPGAIIDRAIARIDKIRGWVESMDSESVRNDMINEVNSLINDINELQTQLIARKDSVGNAYTQMDSVNQDIKNFDFSLSNEEIDAKLTELDKTLEGVAAELSTLNAADPLMSFDDDLKHIDSIRKELPSIGEPTSQLKMLEWCLKVMTDLNFKHEQLKAGIEALDAAREAAYRTLDNIGSWTGGEAAQKKVLEQLDRIEEKLKAIEVSTPSLSKYIDDAIAKLEEIRQKVNQMEDPGIRQEIIDKINEVRDIVRTAILTFNSNVTDHIQNAASGAQKALAEVQNALMGGAGKINGVADTIRGYGAALADGTTSIDAAITLSNTVYGYLSDFADDVRRFVDSDGFRQLMDVLENNPDGLADYLVSPVDMRTEIVYEISDYGSAMAPFYVMIALYVGSLLAATMIKVPVTYPELGRTRGIQRYLGRFAIFLGIGVLQALVTSLGCLYFVGIQCVAPGRFILGCIICSLNFVFMNYSLVYSLDNIGMAISVIVMVIQVAGSGGSYPYHVLPDFFQKLYNLMPFHYGMDMLRETIGGFYDGTYARCAIIMLVMCIVFMALGLALYYPAKKLNAAIAKSKAATGVM